VFEHRLVAQIRPLDGPHGVRSLVRLDVPIEHGEEPLAVLARMPELLLALGRHDRIGTEDEYEGVRSLDAGGDLLLPRSARRNVLPVGPDLPPLCPQGIVQPEDERRVLAAVGEEDAGPAVSSRTLARRWPRLDARTR
jgi:hypothetical protein